MILPITWTWTEIHSPIWCPWGSGVLMQIQDRMEKPCLFVSHALSEQAWRWGITELELDAFVYCVKHLSPYLLGKEFIVRTDHKNLIHLANSTVPKLVRWRIIPSEFKYLIEHIPGASNVVADRLTRVRWIEGRRHPESKDICIKMIPSNESFA